MNGPPSWRMPDRRRQPRDIHVGTGLRILHKCRGGDGDRRLRTQRLAFFHPGFECVERSQFGIEAERQRGALHIRRRIGENTKTALMTFNVVEQQRRAIRHAGGDFGDAADFEARIGAVDAPQRAKFVDESNEFAQIFVHGDRARVRRRGDKVKQLSSNRNMYK